MRVSAELFFLDNLLMDYLMLRLAAVFCGVRLRTFPALLASAGGAAYALLSMTAMPFLGTPVPKLLLGVAVALPLRFSGQSLLKAVLCLYLSAFLTGGMMLGITLLLGGSLDGGVLLGTTPVRLVLLGALLAACLPHVVRQLLTLLRMRARFVPLRITLADRVLTLTALSDSGNLLTEPLTGLPVIVVRPGLLPDGGRAVPYRTVDSMGFLYAVRPVRVETAEAGTWREIDAFVASAPDAIPGADAIWNPLLFSEGKEYANARKTARDAASAVPEPTSEAEQADLLHPLGGDASGAVPAGGGADMDSEAYEG